jgi:hypothetical protein
MTLEETRDAKTSMERQIALALGEFSRATGLAVRNISVHVQGDPDDDWKDYLVDSEVRIQ